MIKLLMNMKFSKGCDRVSRPFIIKYAFIAYSNEQFILSLCSS